MKQINLRRTFRLSTLLLITFVLLSTMHTFAWKPTTHVYLAEQALDDALDNGKVTINRVNYTTGEVIGVIGEYAVDANILSALRNNAAQYRAGVLGPDAYPDILTGQQVIHPVNPNDWFEYLWREAGNDSGAIKAFTLGYITHAAGDMYGHTFINNFTGGAFEIKPPKGPANAIKHVLLEGYVDKRLDASALSGSFFDASISGVNNFIYRKMINAKPGSYLSNNLLPEGGEGTDFSIPRIYSTLRANLQSDIDAYYAKKADYDRRYDNCSLTDFSCSKVLIEAEKTAYVTANGLIVTYKEAWRDDIDEGLRTWPHVSHEVAKALFFNPLRKANVQRAEDILKDYALINLTSMSGAPDFVGIGIDTIGNVIDAITPDFLLEPIRKLKEDLLNTLLEEAIGMNKEDLKKYLTNPELYFDEVMSVGSGENITLASFNSDYLKISDSGYSNPGEYFDYRNFPAAYNTVTINKLMMLSQSGINQLLSDMGSSQRLDKGNVMLGFIQSLDGDNQWKMGMSLAGDCATYTQIFALQAGEKSPCPTNISITPEPTTVAIEAGPIWNQADAETKCPALAEKGKGTWTGHWWTTIQGEMSVCQIKLAEESSVIEPVVVAIEAGPIWNQADAETKCPALAQKEGGTWTGHWWTTVWGEMSVCQIKLIDGSSVDESSVNGKYSNLLQVLNCPKDQEAYGEFNDYGYWGGGAWCGQTGKAGYWVWVAPDWYIWENVNE